MKSSRFPQFLTLALLAFVTFGFAAVSHIQAEQIVYFPLDTNPGWSTEGQWQFGVPLGQGGTEYGYLGSPYWLSGWNCRKGQTITGSTAGAQTNYQMKMTVHKGSGIDSNTGVYCGGNCRDDFGDIRWTTSDGTTLMDYWIESIVSGDNAVFWIEIPSIPASPNTVDVYMYYSNSSATSVSNGANTFFFFDDFTGTSGNDIDSSKWTWGGSHQAKYSTDHPRSGTTGMKLTMNNDCGGEPYHTLSATTGEAIAWLYDPGVGGGSQEAMFGQAFNSTIGIYGNSSSYYKYRIDGGYVNTSVSRTQGWHELKMRSDGNNTYFYIDGTSVATASGMGTFNRVYLGNAHNVNTTDYFDDARVRKYVSPEPTWGIWEFVPPDIFRVTAVVPPEDFITSGSQGGPFSPSSKTYTLTNIGPNSLDWSANITQPWLDIDATAGTLAPGETATVELWLTAEANSLPPGDYNDLITFTNVTSGFVQTRQAILQVIAIPGEIKVTDTIPPPDDLNMPFGGVIVGLPRTEQITITNTDPTYGLTVTDISLGSVRPTWGTSDLSITLPAVAASSPGSGDYYSPSIWAGGAKAESQLIVRAGYKTLSDKIDILLVGGSPGPSRLRTGLAAFPDVNSVGYFNATSGVPTLAQLIAYDVVVVMSGGSQLSNPTQTGNVLADYVDGGGKVIEAVACFATVSGLELAGRFVTGDYEPFTHGSTEATAHSLGDFDQTHPIMAGVTTLTDPVPVRVTLKPQAEWVASWNTGTPLVATRNNNVVGINIFAYDFGRWTGDVVLLFHNAAVWLSQSGSIAAGFTLTDVPSLPVVLPPGGNITFNVIFEPTELKEYKSSVIIKSNDIDESETAVSLSGSGITDYMEVTPDVNFTFSGHPGGPFVPTERSYELTNIGPCDIDWTVSGPNWVGINPTGGSLQTGYSITVDVWPNHNADLLAKGIYDANVVFNNTTTGKTHYRRVKLNVQTDPKIWTDPHQYDVTANQGQNFTTKLTIGNTGDADLEFDLVGTGLNYTPACQESGEPLMLRLDEKYMASLQQRDFAVPEDAPYIEGELLVRFAPDVNDFLPTSQKRGLLISAALGAKAQEKQQYKIVPGLSLIKLPAGVTVKEALAAISSDTTILYAQPNYEYKALITIPNDVRFNELWGMHNTGQTGGTPGADINAPEAWDIATGTGSIVVAVIDTGVDYTHPDLMDNMWVNEAEFNGKPGVDDDGNGYIDDIYGYDFVNNDGNPMDDHYHGTHCAGTVGAIGNNGQGVVGVCWALKIMAVKFLNSSGSGTTAGAISGIQYAMDMDARVMSNSWGGTAYDQGLKDAIDAAGRDGIVFVAAAGNSNCDTDTTRCSNYPSGYDSESIISVMATDKYDAKASFSNYGPVTVDLGAPGVDTLSCEPGGGYRLLSGTSMATPHVAGACALLLSVNPGLGYEQLKEFLMQTVDTTLPGLCVSNGRMNLHRALENVEPASWLRFEPDSGVVGSDSSQDVNVIFDANQPAGMYEGEITVYSNDPFTPESAIPIRINLLPYDWFTELFEPNDPWDPNDPYANDMNNISIVFKPDGMGYYRMACRQQATSFPEDTNGSIAVPLEDDDYEIVDLNGVCVSLYGKEYNRFYIGSNGYISFISGDTSYSESLEQHFLWPRMSALFDDLNPEAGGQISYKILSDKVIVTFENVPEYNLGNLNSFQVEMWFDGKIRMTWLSLGSRGGLVGLSDGTGIPAFFVESDLSSYDQCDFLCDLNRDLETDFGDFATFGQNWQRCIPRPANVAYWKFDESEGAVAYDSSGNNHNGILENGAHFVSGIMNNAVEFDGADDRVPAGAFDVTGGDGHITIAAWIKADDFDVMDGRIISKAAGKAEKNHYWMLSTIFNGRSRLCFSLKSNGVTETLIPSSGYLIPEIWTHVVATWDGSTMRLYKDGVLVGSKAKNGILDTNGDVEVAIGNQPTGAGNKPFDGLIDDLRIYNVALSQSEIQELMYSSEEPICTECDFYPDGLVDSKDLWIFIDHWLK